MRPGLCIRPITIYDEVAEREAADNYLVKYDNYILGVFW